VAITGTARASERPHSAPCQVMLTLYHAEIWLFFRDYRQNSGRYDDLVGGSNTFTWSLPWPDLFQSL